VKGSKTQVQLSAMALESCAASDRKSERKPDIALERSREKPVLVLAGGMIWNSQRRLLGCWGTRLC
jgi:hypothetical protein